VESPSPRALARLAAGATGRRPATDGRGAGPLLGRGARGRARGGGRLAPL